MARQDRVPGLRKSGPNRNFSNFKNVTKTKNNYRMYNTLNQCKGQKDGTIPQQTNRKISMVLVLFFAYFYIFEQISIF
jgi:hypothetical protein